MAQKPRLGLGLVGLGLAKTSSRALVDGSGWARAGLGLKPGFRGRNDHGHDVIMFRILCQLERLMWEMWILGGE